MLLLDLSSSAQAFIDQYAYVGPFVVLVLCGLGVPLPEEIAVLGGGILLFQERAEFWPMAAVCIAGVLCGDAIPYTVGRLFGKRALRFRAVRRLIHPRRFRKLERRFAAQGSWGVFTVRFFPGLRWPGYFIAGSMRMSVPRWLAVDALGAAIQVPLVLHLGRVFGANLDRLEREVEGLQWLLALAAGLLLLGAFAIHRLRKAYAASPQGAADLEAAGEELEALRRRVGAERAEQRARRRGPEPAAGAATGSPPAPAPDATAGDGDGESRADRPAPGSDSSAAPGTATDRPAAGPERRFG